MIHFEGFPQAVHRPHVLYDNLLQSAAVTYSSNASNGPNATDGNTYDAWVPDFGAWSVGVAFTEAKAVDCLCFAAHTLAANGNVILVEWRADEADPWEVAAEFTPVDAQPIMAIWPVVTARYWRIRSTAGTAPAIGVMSLGKRLIFDKGITGSYMPTNWGAEIEVLPANTITGQFMGQRIQRRGGQASVSFGSMDRVWFEEQAEPFIDHYKRALPFFYAGHPQSFPNDLSYCQRPARGANLRPRLTEGGLYVSLSMEVEFHVA